MARVTIMLALVAMILGAPLAALADDVTIKVIEPDKVKPAEQPKPAEQAPREITRPAAPAEGPRVRVDVGDFRLNQALGGLDLSAEQAEKVKQAGGDLTKQLQANNDEARRQMEALRGQTGENVREKMQQIMSDARVKNEEVRKQLVEKINPLLDEEQQAKLKERLAEPDRRGPMAVRSPEEGTQMMLSGIAERAGIKLSDEQSKKLTERLTKLSTEQMEQGRQMFTRMGELREKLRAGDDPEARKEMDELRSKMGEQFRNSMRAYNDAVAAELTDEQKVKFEEAQQQMRVRRNEWETNALVRRAERAGADEGQKAKIEELVKAAVEALNKLGADDEAARGELRQQLEKDILAVLNEEQQKRFSEDRGFGGFGRGMGGRGGDGQGRPGGEGQGPRGGRGPRERQPESPSPSTEPAPTPPI